MNQQIENVRKTRQYLVELIKDLTTNQLNTIPHGFNNNIIWHLGHLIAAQQGVCYIRAGLKQPVDEQLTAPFKPGTKPERAFSPDEIEHVKEVLLSSIDTLENDYNNGTFKTYNTWTTRYGVELRDIDAALSFLIYHEGLHAGSILSQKKLVI